MAQDPRGGWDAGRRGNEPQPPSSGGTATGRRGAGPHPTNIEHARGGRDELKARGLRLSALWRLAVSVAANAGSSYALQLVTLAVATATAALNPLRALNRPELALAVAASYAAWITGLALNAHANWKLLERDGVSVSATSKILHDAAFRAGAVLPLRYAATLLGFVIWEAIEEVPWVLGALGIQAAAAHNHGWSFLAGSNAGAAAYNVAQSALLSRIHSRRRVETPPAASRP